MRCRYRRGCRGVGRALARRSRCSRHPAHIVDSPIAAFAVERDGAIAFRADRDFLPFGVNVVAPWQVQHGSSWAPAHTRSSSHALVLQPTSSARDQRFCASLEAAEHDVRFGLEAVVALRSIASTFGQFITRLLSVAPCTMRRRPSRVFSEAPRCDTADRTSRAGWVKDRASGRPVGPCP